MSRRYPRYVIGVDPSNKSAGVAVFRHAGAGGYVLEFLGSYSPWDGLPELSLEETGTTLVYCEVPSNGTHKSRGGVNWAGGMVIAQLLARGNLSRRRVRKIEPRDWRKPMLGRTSEKEEGALKRAAIAKATEMGARPENDDEAEAFLIGAHAVLEEGFWLVGGNTR